MPLRSHMIQGAPPGTGRGTGEIIIVKYRNTQSILHNKDRLSCQKEKQPVKAKVPYLHWEKGILPTPVLPRLPVPPEGRKKKKHS